MEVFDYQQVITHSTIFHADDVFGVAMCRLINPDIKIVRTLEVEKALKMAKNINEKALVFDIGLGKYDHHQTDKALRPDGTPYCGFGLLWRDFGYLLCPDLGAWSKVDQTLVVQIDKADNGIAQNPLSATIKTMNPKWDHMDSEGVCFCRAMVIAMQILKSHVDYANSEIAARDEVVKNYDGSEILVLDRYLPWQRTVICDDRLKNVLFVVYPSQRGGWNVQTVPTQIGTFENRASFPENLLGHADEEMGITFAHTSNFLISCKTKEKAIGVANQAIAYNRNSVRAVWHF